MYSSFLIDRRDDVEWLTLNRPTRLNAIDTTLAGELTEYFHSAAMRDDVRVIVLKGAGRAFCAGVDLQAFEDMPRDQTWGFAGPARELQIQHANRQYILEMRRCPQPIIALLHGPACGAGFALALAADIRIGARSARMNCAFVNVGLGGCDIGVSYFLPRLIGASIAAELLLTGRFIDAQRAYYLGLLSELVEEEQQLQASGEALVQQLLRVSPLGLRLSKETLRHSIDASSLEAVIAMEDRNQVLCARSEDYHEALAAFRAKRAPLWQNR